MPKGVSKACKDYIKEAEKYLPKTHYYITDVKLALIQQIGTEKEGGLLEVAQADLDLKLQCCRQILELVEKLTPSEKRVRGILLFELQAALTEKARRAVASGEGPDALNSALLESKAMLTECVELLKNEADALPEVGIRRQAEQSLKEIDVLLRTVHMAVGDVPL